MSLAGTRILLVDDETELLSILALCLEEDESATTTATSVAESLALLASDAFDFVVCDAHLRDGDFQSVLQAAIHCDPKPTFVLMTGELNLDVSEIKDIALVLCKPDEIMELSSHISSLRSS